MKSERWVGFECPQCGKQSCELLTRRVTTTTQVFTTKLGKSGALAEFATDQPKREKVEVAYCCPKCHAPVRDDFGENVNSLPVLSQWLTVRHMLRERF